MMPFLLIHTIAEAKPLNDMPFLTFVFIIIKVKGILT